MMTNDDYSEQYDDLEEKDILLGILTELQQIRVMLQARDTSDDDAPPTFACDRCDAEVPKDKRETHARDAHKAPPSMATEIFTRVE
ncbi:hypothetical protein M1M40_gp57 [Halorubrum tailed virus 29]|uniref:Uncharacterized protein n=1 Tax=Halorubrum tailed virus 29 TaxID=2878010 RepID=A0AAE9BY88_9CAUD|nr:hypothetical protein M1M40_gp57 [Halorubrum tailed virus 29]UBF23335.1 hypothetical protein HRTV-29_gp57 [Halorubrum tailed virus 29]